MRAGPRRLRPAAAALAAALLALPVAVSPAAAQPELVVNVLDDPAPDGSCVGGSGCSLREAILESNASPGGFTLRLGAGTYRLTLGAAGNDSAGSGDLDVLQPLTVIGAGAQATVIDVVVADRAFDSHAVPLTLADLAVTGGGTVDEGGAVRATGGHLTLTRARVAGSLATVGAGIFATGPLTLTDTVVEGNAALAAGGGIAAIGPGPVTVEGGVLRGNTSGQLGGGLYSAGPVVLRDVVIEDNHADEAGGGLAVEEAPLGGPTRVELTDSVLANNRSFFGGGLSASAVELAATRLAVEGNSATVGGGMALSDVTGALVDSHLVANASDDAGGGLATTDGGQLRVERSLVEANVGFTGAGIAAGATLELVTTTVSGNLGSTSGGVYAEEPLTVISSTIAANAASAGTAGNLLAEAPVTLTGSLLAQPGGATPGDDVNCAVSGAGTVTGTGSVADDGSCALPAGNRNAVDAALRPLAANGGALASHALGLGSAALDAAGTQCPATDARDVMRPVDGDLDGVAACDAGAYELVPGADLVVALADGPDPLAVGEVLTITASVFNTGPVTAVAAELVLTLPATLPDPTVEATAGTCAVEAAGTVRCMLGDLTSGTEATVRARARPTAAGTLQTEARATSLAVDPTPDDAVATTTTTVTQGPATSGVIPTAIAISQQRFPGTAAAGGGQGRPSGVVLSRDDLFADSLAGAVLTADAPLLFTATAALDPRTAGEIERLLGGSGTVTLLGGEPALSAAVADALEAGGYTVRRLFGPSRVETAVAIAAAVAPGGTAAVALARADAPPGNPTAAWADAVTGGAWSAATGTPVLLTPSAELHPAVAGYLASTNPADRVLLGGEAALSAAVADGVGAHRRVSGANRYATAAAIATALFGQPHAGYLVTAGDHADGWAYALAAAGLAADTNQPLALVETGRLPTETRELTCAGGALAATTVIGDDTVVAPATRDALRQPC